MIIQQRLKSGDVLRLEIRPVDALTTLNIDRIPSGWEWLELYVGNGLRRLAEDLRQVPTEEE